MRNILQNLDRCTRLSRQSNPSRPTGKDICKCGPTGRNDARSLWRLCTKTSFCRSGVSGSWARYSRINLNLQSCLFTFSPPSATTRRRQIDIRTVVGPFCPLTRYNRVIMFKLGRSAWKRVGQSGMEGEFRQRKRRRIQFNGDGPGISAINLPPTHIGSSGCGVSAMVKNDP